MSYQSAKEKYAKIGVDTEKALNTLKDISVSIHCWQGDDVGGFDSADALSGGIQATVTTREKSLRDAEERHVCQIFEQGIAQAIPFLLQKSLVNIKQPPVLRLGKTGG